VTEPALLAHGVTAKVLAELERDSFVTTSIDGVRADANLSGDELSVSCWWRLERAPQATHRPAEHVAGASGFHKPPEALASHPRWRASTGTPSAPTRSSSGPCRIRMIRLLRSADAVVTSAFA
jgi:hypothetical protein